MRHIERVTSFALATALLAALAADAFAQQRLSVNWPRSDNPEAQAHIDEGDELLGQQKYSEARLAYEKAAEMIRADGEFPNTAMHRMAVSYWYEGLPQTAASQLDGMADDASTYGDLVSEVWALADAAWIHGRVGDRIDMEVRVQRLKKLLKSPYLPGDVRAQVESKRLGEATTLSSK